LNPFEGGEVSLFGWLINRGRVRSSRDSGQYVADLSHLAGAPEASEAEVADGVRVERLLWRNESGIEVGLVALHGGGHAMPQPYRRNPRLPGPTPREPNGPEEIWAFLERH
jgi:polyhydroxybutyrate depolymerase